jgi:hypothetical protein
LCIEVEIRHSPFNPYHERIFHHNRKPINRSSFILIEQYLEFDKFAGNKKNVMKKLILFGSIALALSSCGGETKKEINLPE